MYSVSSLGCGDRDKDCSLTMRTGISLSLNLQIVAKNWSCLPDGSFITKTELDLNKTRNQLHVLE